MTDDLAALLARRARLEVKKVAAEPGSTAAQRRDPVKAPTAPARRRAAAAPVPPAKPKAKGRVVKTEAGARRYGVAIGEVYTREGAQGELARGAAGERVRQVQDQLGRAGFLDESSGRNKGRDGLLGPKTEDALKRFQKAAGLPPTGKFDAATSKRLADTAPGGDPPAGKLPAKQTGSNADAAARSGAARAKAKVSKPVARPGAKKVDEDEVPMTSRSGAKLIDYANSAAVYEDGSVYDGLGWQPKKARRLAQ